LADYSYKLYKEYNYDVTEILDYENLKIDNIFTEELVSGILIFELN
jgi:hypothetical protein